MLRQRSREAELSALYETARDLTAIRDLDEILAAIVRRARQLLHADMTYLSLNDEAEGASYMKVTDGALTPSSAAAPAARHGTARTGRAGGGAVLHRGLPGRRALPAP